MNPPTVDEPLYLEPCPDCRDLVEGSENCPTCHGEGRVVLADRCPLEVITPDTWDMLDTISFFENAHLPPVAGGSLDQTRCFLQSLALSRSTERGLAARSRA